MSPGNPEGLKCVFVLQMFSNGDSVLDSKEFLNFLRHNESALNLTYSKTLETNSLMRYIPQNYNHRHQ